jgi:hypothetical protein
MERGLKPERGVDKYAYREYSNDYPRLFEGERDRVGSEITRCGVLIAWIVTYMFHRVCRRLQG